MLTKDLLRFRNLSGYVKPMFVDPADPRISGFAGELIGTYRSMTGDPKTAIEDTVMPLVNSKKDIRLAGGILKTLDDACTSTGVADSDYPELRKKLFRRSSELLSGELENDDPEKFRDQVFAAFDDSLIPLQENIYADLPDYERLETIPDWTPEELLGRYNCSLAQSLLIYAKSMELTITEPDPGKMRRLFKYMKFFRLLASIKSTSQWNNGTPAGLTLMLDGPASILENGTAYGLRMASFLPAVFQLSSWKVSCILSIKNRSMKFNLDEAAGLNRRFGTFSCYIPEEYTMFEKLFAEKSESWKLTEDTPFIRIKKSQDFIFPDMTFTDGRHTISLELFHKWHARQLEDRLKMLSVMPDLPLIIGADRSIFGRKEECSTITEHPLYGKKIFLFRDFPGVANVLKLLEKNFPAAGLL